MRRYREGDFVRTPEGLFFGVKGLLHPNHGVIAFLRHVPDQQGGREKEGIRYRKIHPLKNKYEYLRKNHPNYLHYSQRLDREIQTVPIKKIEEVYKPVEQLAELIKRENRLSILEKSAVKLSEKIMDESQIKMESIGVTGSLLVGLDTRESDIDLIIYGEEEGRRAYSALRDLRNSDKQISPYDLENGVRIAKSRWPQANLQIEKLAMIESEKLLHGTFENRGFFIKLVKDWKDIRSKYEDYTYFNLGRTKIIGIISDDVNSIFTPCSYGVEESQTLGNKDYDIKKIVSFRGKFPEQAKKGDKIRAEGRIEKVVHGDGEYLRLILEEPQDYLIPINK
ncbi:hypothetical protein AKJ47_01875 [candidate division MSBL1 archaeon SCGC-AAA261G05]|uniref:Polymerase nucleotidyl transferase domain-containing protein n=2 Tax=candidate division MSBL1 TaxID=215777 RepID=A0A133V142_9EURY|nr:hypothetical protein AKJ42_01475 [candidate division MSBL1 archaeon SCGC-AAA261C02]KXB03642.1 hypothetical protein AKJ47_01875 [candidate division MSBL1 archaeon SCGC-AAA261G05]